MIGAFAEGVQQALLPCSWVVLVPSALVGLVSRSARAPLAFTGAIVVTGWVSVSGWVNPPHWVAGTALAAGGLLLWLVGPVISSSVALGLGAAWAWIPCVGEELGTVLNTAQRDPIAALPGFAAFMIAVVGVGFALGLAVAWAGRRIGWGESRRVVAALFGLLGLLMITGLYSRAASELARWSTELWS